MDVVSYLLGKEAGGGSEPSLESKSVTITTNTVTTVTPGSQYDGLSSVEITTEVEPNLESKEVSITSNGTTTVSPTSGYDGLSQVEINTSVTPNLESKEVNITGNGMTTVLPTSGYDGLSDVKINTNIEYQDYWPSNLNRIYSNNASYSVWAFPDTVVSIPAGTYLFTCNNSHVEVEGDNMNNNVNKFICKDGQNYSYPYYFGGTSCGFVFTSEIKKIALYLCPNITLSNIKLLKIM